MRAPRLFGLIVRGQVVHVVYSNFTRMDPDGFLCDFRMKDRAGCLREWMGDDEPALQAAEAQMQRLVEVWLVWLRCRSAEPPPALRMDFLLHRPAAGQVAVHTLELTELGFSMLAWQDGPRYVFGALMESCFDDTGPTAEDSARLAAYIGDVRPPSAFGSQPGSGGREDASGGAQGDGVEGRPVKRQALEEGLGS
jgi:hypothetical protein